MGDSILFFTHPLNGLLMVSVPLLLAAYLTRRFSLPWRLVWIGGATFLLSQALHIPANLAINRLFASGMVPLPPEPWRLPLLAAIGGLSAGVFEEGTRYAVYRWWARDARSWHKALLLGAGHGGAESVLLGLLVLLSVISMFGLRGTDLSTVVPADQLGAAQQQVTTYWSMPWPDSLLGAVERILTLPVQMGFSVLVLQAFTRRQVRWLLFAVLWHATIDGVIAGYMAPQLLGRYNWAAYALEAMVALATATSLGLMALLRTPEPLAAVALEPLPGPAPAFYPQEVPETPESLEDTRYHD